MLLQGSPMYTMLNLSLVYWVLGEAIAIRGLS